MASTKTRATTNPRSVLPQRFRPLYDSALAQSQLRYGAQEAGLGSLLDSLTHDYTQNALAQRSASESILGSLKNEPTQLSQTYAQAGLTPQLLQNPAFMASPSGQRIAGELASNQAVAQQQLAGAQAGQQFIQSHLADQYQQDKGKIADQLTSLLADRGTFEQQTLADSISSDRAARHAANVAAANQRNADQKAILDRQSAQTNALIGQGLLPDDKGNLTPLPGGKADPKAASNRTTGPGTASRSDQTSEGKAFSRAVALAQALAKGQSVTPELHQAVVNILTNGRPAKGGKPIYDQVPETDPYGKPKLDANGKPVVKQVKRLNPDGSQATSQANPAIPAFDQAVAQAASEQALYGYVTTSTVQQLQSLGYSVRQIPGLTTQNQYRQTQPRQRTPKGNRYGGVGRGADTT